MNKINPFKATWKNNFIYACKTWVAMEKPFKVCKNSKRPFKDSIMWKVRMLFSLFELVMEMIF